MIDEPHIPYLLAGAALFVVGFHGLVSQPHLLKKILAVNIMSSGTALVFIALAARTLGDVPDPIPHAMVLTGIVVAVCATGLALALAERVQAANGKPEIDDADDKQNIVLLHARYSSWLNQKKEGITDERDLRVELNQIRYSLLTFAHQWFAQSP